jgi:hypothetical protein
VKRRKRNEKVKRNKGKKKTGKTRKINELSIL